MTANAMELSPTRANLQEAALRALSPRLGEDEVRKFLTQVSSTGVPAPLGAEASVNIAIYGKVHCNPDGQPYKYDTTIWGGPAYFGSSIGFLYTAYGSWDAFFRNVTSCHVQGIDVGGGILQINFFIENGTPVGQYNGAAGGVGLVEAGGSGKWQHI